MKPLAVRNKKTGDITSYQFRVYVGENDFGKKCFKTKTWKPERQYTQKQLEKELLRQQVLFEEEVLSEKQDNFSLKITNKTKFKEFSDYWIENYSRQNHKHSTTVSYERYLKNVNKHIGNMALCKIVPITINSLYNKLREKSNSARSVNGTVAEKTIRNYHGLLCSIFHSAVEWNVLQTTQNPMNGVRTPKVIRKKAAPFTAEEVKVILSSLEKENIKNQVFVKLGITTGMRRGELMGLRWVDVDFEKETVSVVQTRLYNEKGDSYIETPKTSESARTIKVSSPVMLALLDYKIFQEKNKATLGDDWIESGLVFVSEFGKPIHPNSTMNWFKNFQKKNGIEPRSIHSMRHTTATLLILNGVNTKLVSGRLGHSDTSTTNNIYASYVKEADEIVVDTLDQILFDNNNT